MVSYRRSRLPRRRPYRDWEIISLNCDWLHNPSKTTSLGLIFFMFQCDLLRMQSIILSVVPINFLICELEISG